jgi:hypothetical protein
MAMQLNDRLQPGRGYTFKFTPCFNPAEAVEDVIAAISRIDYLGDFNVKWGGFGPWGSVAVSFGYYGDGTDSVDYVASDIISAVNQASTLGCTMGFVSADLTGTNSTSGGTQDILDSFSGALKGIGSGDIKTTLYLVLGILIVVSFLASGGASLFRRASGA